MVTVFFKSAERSVDGHALIKPSCLLKYLFRGRLKGKAFFIACRVHFLFVIIGSENKPLMLLENEDGSAEIRSHRRTRLF